MPGLVFAEKYSGIENEQAKRLYMSTHANILTGNFIEQQSDIKIESPGLEIELIRTYNSNKGHERTMLGYGWMLNYETSMKDVEDTSGIVTASALNVREYPYGRILTVVTRDSKLIYIQKMFKTVVGIM